MFDIYTVHSSYVSAHGGRLLARRHWLAAGGALALGLVAGCATKPVITPVTLTLHASNDVNPDAQRRASPVVARLYVLKATGEFELADFFALQDKDAATLGADLMQREEVILRPGEQKRFDLKLGADAKALGFMGGYRDLARARWRQSMMLTPGQPLTVTASFGAQGIALAQR